MEVAVMGQGKSIRLDRILAEMKQGTRSQVKEMIRKGRVLVDGTVCRESDRKIFPDETRVTLDGQPVGWADTEYYMLNKPQGVVSATEDGRYQTVIDLIDEAKRKDLFPVGRLDIDTEGLLLITNDGALAHELLAPKKHVDKVYFARVKGTLKEGIEARKGNTERRNRSALSGGTDADGWHTGTAGRACDREKMERRRRRPLRGAPDHP